MRHIEEDPVKVVSLRQELLTNATAYHPSYVSIQNRIESSAEADRILNEIKKINVQDLGAVRAIGRRLRMQSRKGTQDADRKLYPF